MTLGFILVKSSNTLSTTCRFFTSLDFNSIYCKELGWLFPRIRNVIGKIRSNPIQFLSFTVERERENENLFTVAFIDSYVIGIYFK